VHFLLVLILLCLVFPWFARFLGSLISAAFWLFVIVIALATIGAFSR
jgi:hypothetical protein